MLCLYFRAVDQWILVADHGANQPQPMETLHLHAAEPLAWWRVAHTLRANMPTES